jgi:PLP dependent protein
VAPLDPGRVRANLEEVRAEVGPDVEILAATKYVALEDIGALVEAGVTLAGENRAP